MGFILLSGFWVDMEGYGFDNDSEILVHTVYYGVLCYFLFDSMLFDELYEAGVRRSIFVGNGA